MEEAKIILEAAFDGVADLCHFIRKNSPDEEALLLAETVRDQLRARIDGLGQ